MGMCECKEPEHRREMVLDKFALTTDLHVEWSSVTRNQGVEPNRIRWPSKDPGGQQCQHGSQDLRSFPQKSGWSCSRDAGTGTVGRRMPSRTQRAYTPSCLEESSKWEIKRTESWKSIKTLKLFTTKISGNKDTQKVVNCRWKFKVLQTGRHFCKILFPKP